ncbi:UNVERIFIED_CONTAM: hypothetical protein K2H54_049960 [Gekko kuhli]
MLLRTWDYIFYSTWRGWCVNGRHKNYHLRPSRRGLHSRTPGAEATEQHKDHPTREPSTPRYWSVSRRGPPLTQSTLHVRGEQVDLACITETWVRDGKTVALMQLAPPGFSVLSFFNFNSFPPPTF